ncbi:MAG: hypothetical protein KBC41_00800 [Candidatus Pacebacteria bacterium]|nr:hypothetical protein [Candidatus Paceibacterota bacterium]
MKNIFIVILVLIIGVGVYMLLDRPVEKIDLTTDTEEIKNTNNHSSTTETVIDKTKTVIGTSVEGNEIVAYHYGKGTNELLLIGGIHGGYEWNTVLLAYDLMDYFKANPNSIPDTLKITIIPVMNPDGLHKVVGTTGRFLKTDVSTLESVVTSGRFNGNNVDLSRNFDCNWKSEGVWQNKTVSAGSNTFSEPESKAIKEYTETHTPISVVVWYSAAGGVFASSCNNGVSTETSAITKVFATASGYPAYDSFDFYATTGDMVNWFAKNNIPAISILLTNHTGTDWAKNIAGVKALLTYYTK